MAILTSDDDTRNGCEIFWLNNIGNYTASNVNYIPAYNNMINYDTSKTGRVVPVIAGDFVVNDENTSTHMIALTKSGTSGTDTWELTGSGGTFDIDVVYSEFDKIFIKEFDETDINNLSWGSATGSKDYAYIFIGKPLKMPHPIFGGHAPLELNQKSVFQAESTGTGQFLGRKITRKSLRTTFVFNNLDIDFYKSEFQQFVVHARTKPFFIRWRPDKFTNEISYGMVEGNIRPRMQTSDLISVSFDFVGYVQNDNT